MQFQLPGEQSDERVRDGRRRSLARVGAHHRHAGAARVEAVHMGSHDALPRTAGAPHVDRAEAVDEEVVADVAPAEACGVVDVDAADERGGLLPGVLVASRRVMHESHLDRRRDRAALAQRLVGAPSRSRHPRGRLSRRLGRGRQSRRGDRRDDTAQDVPGLRDDPGAALGVEGGQLDPRQDARGMIAHGDGADLYEPSLSGPEGVHVRLRGLPVLGGDLERRRVPAAPDASVDARAEPDLDLGVVGGRVAHEAEHGEARAGVDGLHPAVARGTQAPRRRGVAPVDLPQAQTRTDRHPSQGDVPWGLDPGLYRPAAARCGPGCGQGHDRPKEQKGRQAGCSMPSLVVTPPHTFALVFDAVRPLP